MYQPQQHLNAPNKFDFPFTPYKIQHDFMTHLYETIENQRIGIFESPTGTGKSLSLICGSLKWLKDHEELVKTELTDTINKLKCEIADADKDDDGFDWIESQSKIIQKREELTKFQKTLDQINQKDEEFVAIKKQQQQKKEKPKWTTRKKRNEEFDLEDEISKDEEFVIDDYDVNANLEEEQVVEKFHGVQILFCSRTHSQLTQVVNELKNTVYGKDIRIAILGSRQNYCINASVQNLKTNSSINERCIELQKCKTSEYTTSTDKNNGTSVKKTKLTVNIKCPYFGQSTIKHLRNEILTSVMDIENLVEVAKVDKTCPYYASRLAAQDAQIIMFPYQMLLHKPTRKQTGIVLKNSIVIIDEAHNLIDTISNVYSSEISHNQLQRAHQHLLAYKNKYFTRFSTINLLKLNQLLFVTNRLIKLLDKKVGKVDTRIVLAHELMVEGDFFNIKLNELLDFCEKTHLAQKIQGFVRTFANELSVMQSGVSTKPNGTTYLTSLSEKLNKKNDQFCVKEEDTKTNTSNLPSIEKTSSIRPVLVLLDCFMEKSKDGRVILTYSDGLKSKSSMKFVLLNPSNHFEDILNECRAVIVAGGTMQPTDEFKNQLFASHQDRVSEHLFNHVVSNDAILPLAIPQGPSNVKFLFNFNNRNSKELLLELIRTLQNVCNVVPSGIVCFFGSYDYMETFYRFMDETGGFDVVKRKKQVFKEPRNSNDVEKMLVEYSKVAKNPGGALLFSVVGGKLSEGLNFSDELGRCVIVVGMPYPNKNSPELAEKIDYLNKTFHSTAGTEYYENLCIKAVNQCIGRAVRHINDYAAVLLLDERYGNERIIKKLPIWIRQSLQCTKTFGIVQSSLAKFFKTKNKI